MVDLDDVGSCESLARSHLDANGGGSFMPGLSVLGATAALAKACELRGSFTNACYDLAARYEAGEKVTGDLERATHFYKLGCAKRHAPYRSLACLKWKELRR